MGHVYMCYKSTVMVWDIEIMRKTPCGSCVYVLQVSEKTYRRACNQAMNSNFNQLSLRINDLYRGRHMKGCGTLFAVQRGTGLCVMILVYRICTSRPLFQCKVV